MQPTSVGSAIKKIEVNNGLPEFVFTTTADKQFARHRTIRQDNVVLLGDNEINPERLFAIHTLQSQLQPLGPRLITLLLIG